MSPLAPSESVDAFLAWLAQPANPVVTPPGHGHGHSHGHHHSHAHGQGHNGLGFVPQKGKVSDSDKEQEYAARLRELARSPLEEMAKPLLVSPVVPMRTPSDGKMRGKNGKEGKEKKEKRRSESGNSSSTTATPMQTSTQTDASKMKTGSQVKAQ